MKRFEFLKAERERVIAQIFKDKKNRAHWLAVLIDLDEEIEERSRNLEYEPLQGECGISKIST